LSTDRIDDDITKLNNSAVGASLTFTKVTDGSGHDHIKVDGKDAKKLLELIEELEALDDVAKVSSNFDIDAEAMAAATA